MSIRTLTRLKWHEVSKVWSTGMPVPSPQLCATDAAKLRESGVAAATHDSRNIREQAMADFKAQWLS